MEQSFDLSHLDKKQRYTTIIPQLKALVDGEDNRVGAMANVSAALHEAFGFFWVGFYIVNGDVLKLGPFQGSVACYTIAKGKGVCGTAWQKVQTMVVDDVDTFPGHIACSSLSKSEIVVPIIKNDEVVAVLDIDSDKKATFDDTDKMYLESIAELLANTVF